MYICVCGYIYIDYVCIHMSVYVYTHLEIRTYVCNMYIVTQFHKISQTGTNWQASNMGMIVNTTNLGVFVV